MRGRADSVVSRGLAALAGLAVAVAAAGALVAAGAGPAAAATGPGIIRTVAGGAGRGVARKVSQIPTAVAAGPGDAVYVGGDDGVVRLLHVGSDWETTVAGVGLATTGYAGSGGLAGRARLGRVSAVATDLAGDLAIADRTNGRVLLVPAASGTFSGQAMTAGDIYSVAGDTGAGYSGDGGPATAASLFLPWGLAFDSAGNLVILDAGNRRVRVVAASDGTFYGQPMTTGDIYTIAGNGGLKYPGDGVRATAAAIGEPQGLALDGAGNVVIGSTSQNRILVVASSTGTFYGQAMTAGDIYTMAGTGATGFSGDGGPAASARLNQPAGVTADPHGNLIFADYSNQRVRVIAAATGTFYGVPMTAGDIYTVAGDGTVGYSGEGVPAATASLGVVLGVTIDSAGNLVAAVTQQLDRVRVVAASDGTFYGVPMTAGNLYTAAGNGQRSLSGNNYRAINAEFESPGGIAVDPAGDLAIFDYAEVRLIPAAAATMFGRPMVAGHVYDVAGTGHTGISGDGGLATGSPLWQLFGGAFDPAGNLVVADEAGGRLRLVAATTGTFYGQAMTAGHIYTVAGTGTQGFSGDGGPATVARLSVPAGVAVGSHGNLVFADNCRVRVVAAATGTFYGQAMTAGDIYTIAGTGTFSFSGDGGPATAAALSEAVGVALDGAGNVVIADTYNHRIRVIAEADGTFYGQAMTAGRIYTVAGTGARDSSSGNGGPATAADLELPWGIAVDPAGNLMFGDGLDGQVRLVAATSGTAYGLAVTAGDIYAVAGTGQAGFAGDTHEAARARLTTPSDVAFDPAGDLIITDTGNHRVRIVTS